MPNSLARPEALLLGSVCVTLNHKSTEIKECLLSGRRGFSACDRENGDEEVGRRWPRLPDRSGGAWGPGRWFAVWPMTPVLGAVFLQLTLLTCKHNSCSVVYLGGFHVCIL